MLNHPVLSVVTVTFNAIGCVEKTLQSVISQDYENLQYLVIDGGSTDGTQDVVSRYLEKIDYFVSEKDGGIYFGMNKGIDAASGDYVLFLNAGDIFFDSKVLSDVASFLSENVDVDILYGNVEHQYEYGNFIVKPQTAYHNHKMCISHQATFVRHNLLLENKFDIRYKYAADFEQLSSLFLNGYNFKYFDRVISRIEMKDGATYRHFEDSANELYDIIASRGIDIEAERKTQIRRKRYVRFFKNILPEHISNLLFGFLAKHYKAL